MRLTRCSWKIFPLVLLAFTLLSRESDACCGVRDPEFEAAEATDVFRGRLRGYSRTLTSLVPEPMRSKIQRLTPESMRGFDRRLEPKCQLEFDVTRVYKGPDAPTRTVLFDGPCSWLPPSGGEWLVLATRNGIWLDIGSCSATGPLRYDPSELEGLGPGHAPDPRTSRSWLAIVGGSWVGFSGLVACLVLALRRRKESAARAEPVA